MSYKILSVYNKYFKEIHEFFGNKSSDLICFKKINYGYKKNAIVLKGNMVELSK